MTAQKTYMLVVKSIRVSPSGIGVSHHERADRSQKGAWDRIVVSLGSV
jgi:hypothetical protein